MRRSVTLSEGGSLATMNSSDCYHTVANKTVMHAGRHYAQFTVVKICNSGPLFGVIRPGWDVGAR
jgi:hypothetical protein